MERFKLSLAGRERLSYGIILVMLLWLMAGLVKLQIAQHNELAIKSENNRLRVVPIIPRRGLVYDREGRIIIDNRPSYTVSVVPAEEVPELTISNLGELLGMDTLQIRNRIQRNLVSRYQPSMVKRDISFEAVAILEEQSKHFPGVTYQMEQVRQYNSDLGVEVVTGYVGEASEEELKRPGNEGYRLGSIIGKKGLEKQYDKVLRGREGTAYIEVSAAGQILGEYVERRPIPAIPGSNLTLTIDNDLQLACVQTLDTFCCGAIVAINPVNGEILAMTSYPGYDANIFSSVIPESLWVEISNDTTHPLLNRPLKGLYPPGSTVKFIAVGAALEEGIVSANSTLKPCLGGMQFGNRFFRCWQPGGHGSLSAAHALEQSCDVYLYQAGIRLGVDKLAEYYDRCGFGYATGVDLPNEDPGLNPDSRWYDRHYGVNKWTRALVLNNAIGQGELLSTPIQLARFFCALANDGTAYEPYIVKKVTHPDGSELNISPKMSFRLPFSNSTVAILREGMRLVVEGEHGTARRLKNNLYSIGGKTGTAQNPHGEDHSWFVGVAPIDNPEIVVCAIVENAGHGSDVAAPLVGQIIRTYMDKKMAPEAITMTAEDGE
ncbi:MAG: penicillin-binding protein 2 [Candidatus Zixiibacteriota bacterium]|nr:MAG: penicillin-binding protein 2 [candidate division Zixibacteria bacterium]